MITYYDNIRKVQDLHLSWGILTDINIPIVGASGPIGRTLVDALMQLPDKTFHLYADVRDLVYTQSHFMRYKDDKFFTLIQCDVAALVPSDIDFHYIIHIANYARPAAFHNDPVGIMKANILGADNLFPYGEQHDPRRLLYVSSSEAYGEGNGIPFREKNSDSLDWVSLRACYPAVKRTAETLCIIYTTQLQIETVIACPCHIYGPFYIPKDDCAYAQFIRNVLTDESIVLRSSDLQQRSWCYVVDCVFALPYILLKGKTKNAYNITDVQSNVSVREFAEMVALKSEREVIFDLPDNTGKNRPIISQAVFNAEKVNKIGWLPQWKPRENVSHTLNTLISVDGTYM